MEFSTLVQFSKLVSDSATSEGIFSLLAETVVEKCGAFHTLIFGTSDNGDFRLLSAPVTNPHSAGSIWMEYVP
ncbi:MAG: hypothetical protein DMG14_33580 [Acidobacteria bacterium]|nr:MAG: hypothetical protein DMG14_33580 [Acidobacteriota bacterium]